jgi:choloylglycine hydrolase
VAEVIASAKKIRIAENGTPLHYLVADATGDVATIEFLDGALVAHRGRDLPVAALANDTYESSLDLMKRGSNDRFARVAKGLGAATTVDGSFELLDRVRQPSTQWQIVYDIRNRTIHWRTAANRDRRNVRMASFDFACAAPVRTLDIDRGRGDVAPLFRDYRPDENLALVRRSTRGTSFLRDTTDAEIEESARWPERSSCAR